jgi:hypothetical protein
MRLFSISKPLLILGIGLVPVMANAQTPGVFKRLQIGYSFLSEKATYERTYPVPNTALLKIDDSFRDTTIAVDVKPTSSIGGFLGTYIRVAKLGKASTVNFSIEANVNMMTWDKATTDGKEPTPDDNPELLMTGSTTHIGMPLGFDIKFGSDAYPDKSYRWCAGFGVGANTGSASTTLNGESGSEILVRPYIRGEVGIFGGMCFKLRLAYNFGKVQYIHTDNSKANAQGNIYQNTTTLTGQPGFTTTLIVMPFASTWDKSRWWK